MKKDQEDTATDCTDNKRHARNIMSTVMSMNFTCS